MIGTLPDVILACLILLRVYPKLLSVEWVLFNDQTEVTSGQTKHAKNLGCTQQDWTIWGGCLQLIAERLASRHFSANGVTTPIHIKEIYNR